MSRSKPKKKTGGRPSTNATLNPLLDPFQTGRPALDSVTGVDEFRRGKKIFRVIHTKEVDEYESGASKAKRKPPE